MIPGDFSYVRADMVEPRVVRAARKAVVDYVADQPVAPVRDGMIPGTKIGGHTIFSHATAIGLAHLQWRLQDTMRLKVISADGVREVERKTWLKRPPMTCNVGVTA